MDLPPLLEPWSLVTNEASALEAELLREISPVHVFFGRIPKAVARRQDSDDVLFLALDDPFLIAVVHLTWSGNRETDPCLPGTALFSSIDDWVDRRMNVDHADVS